MTNPIHDEKIKILKTKAQSFFDQKIPVHINYKQRGIFKNGNIIEMSSDFFMLDEFREKKIPVFFLEIDDIKIYHAKDDAE